MDYYTFKVAIQHNFLYKVWFSIKTKIGKHFFKEKNCNQIRKL